ncbi:MAG: CBS domain-containing protein [Gammaproteobacteria bacterium]|nr:CBS domain-containing protein [Gammaproteobacteria bacterium]
MKTVKQLLREKGSAVHTISPHATVLEALHTMAELNIGALIVVEGDQIAGLLSERDYARKGILEGRYSKDTKVRDLMTSAVVCVSPEQTVDACMALMTEKRVRHLPVLEGGRLAGIVSIGDALKTIIEDQQFTIDQLAHYISGTP